MSNDPEQEIVSAWQENAVPWTEAVRNDLIQSRNLITNDAIVDRVLRDKPATALDVGCGEGWLVRSLAQYGVHCTGVDAVPALIASARQAGAGDYHVMPYHELSSTSPGGRYDVVICNFSLLGDTSVTDFFNRVPALLTETGGLIIQTLHPLAVSEEQRDIEGWKMEEWTGFGGRFQRHSPWYYRTLAGWDRLFAEAGLTFMTEETRPLPGTECPASLILSGKKT